LKLNKEESEKKEGAEAGKRVTKRYIGRLTGNAEEKRLKALKKKKNNSGERSTQKRRPVGKKDKWGPTEENWDVMGAIII